jgi:hypothetical protein
MEINQAVERQGERVVNARLSAQPRVFLKPAIQLIRSRPAKRDEFAPSFRVFDLRRLTSGGYRFD